MLLSTLDRPLLAQRGLLNFALSRRDRYTCYALVTERWKALSITIMY